MKRFLFIACTILSCNIGTAEYTRQLSQYASSLKQPTGRFITQHKRPLAALTGGAIAIAAIYGTWSFYLYRQQENADLRKRTVDVEMDQKTLQSIVSNTKRPAVIFYILPSEKRAKPTSDKTAYPMLLSSNARDESLTGQKLMQALRITTVFGQVNKNIYAFEFTPIQGFMASARNNIYTFTTTEEEVEINSPWPLLTDGATIAPPSLDPVSSRLTTYLFRLKFIGWPVFYAENAQAEGLTGLRTAIYDFRSSGMPHVAGGGINWELLRKAFNIDDTREYTVMVIQAGPMSPEDSSFCPGHNPEKHEQEESDTQDKEETAREHLKLTQTRSVEVIKHYHGNKGSAEIIVALPQLGPLPYPLETVIVKPVVNYSEGLSLLQFFEKRFACTTLPREYFPRFDQSESQPGDMGVSPSTSHASINSDQIGPDSSNEGSKG